MQSTTEVHSELVNEDLLLRVRCKLNSDHIKLWQEPYYTENNERCDKEIETLARKYAVDLVLQYEPVLSALKELQSHALQRVKANDEFKETGIALLRIKVPPQPDGSKILNLQIKLEVIGDDLIKEVSNKIFVDPVRVKLIHQGRVVKRDERLTSQQIKNGAQILTVLLADSPTGLRKVDDIYSEMQLARHDAELLSDSADNDHYMQLEDQHGNTIKLPPREKKALMIAMTLHERGRNELKLKNYPLALVLLSEADNHFSGCNADILKTVDNYALLNLDIAWCYLCLQSITHIPDAESRLKLCEKKFHESYGQNLERLLALKGTSGNEKALFMRLHLLQAIVLYHQNKRPQAKALMERAEHELSVLKVNDDSLCAMMDMGFTLVESRMALRACEGNVQTSVEFVNKRRQQKIENRKKAKEERESRALGKCIDGQQYVSMPFVKMLVDMGYSKNKAILALKNSNNHVSNAVQIILEQPHLLNENDLPRTVLDSNEISQHALSMLVSMGFNSEMAESALKELSNNLEEAAEVLTLQGGLFFSKPNHDSSNPFGNTAAGSSSSSSSSSSLSNAKQIEKEKEAIKKKLEVKAAFDRISEGIEDSDDGYLDLTLVEEEEFLGQYKTLLNQ